MSLTPERLVIANTSPLLYLHLVSHLELLRTLYGRVVVPPAVAEELQVGAELGADVPDLSASDWIQVQPLQSDALVPAVMDLGRGEAEVIGLGRENPNSLVILDDSLARCIAEVCGLTVTGTVGVLLKAKQEGHLGAVSPVVQALRDAGLWLSDDLVELVLQRAGE